MRTKVYFATVLILTLALSVLWGQDMGDSTRIKINESLDRSTVLISLKGSGDDNGIGSGFVVSAEGWILTNYHVVADPQFSGGEILVKFKDGGVYPGEVIGTDAANDLALLKMVGAPKHKLTPLKLGDSDRVVVGQTVLAKGNPLGLEGTLSQGIISAVRNLKSLSGEVIKGAIQTDAAIAQGNSGGPLVNAQGEVIGIISAGVYNPAGGNIFNNINFAVPANRAKEFLRQVQTQGIKPGLPPRAHQASRSRAQAPSNPPDPAPGGSQRRSSRDSGSSQNPNIGFGSTTGSSQQTSMGVGSDWLHLGIDGEDYSDGKVSGVKVLSVEPNSPAARAGLRSDQDPLPNNLAKRGQFASPGHVITAVDGTKIQSVDDLSAALSEKFPGDSVTFHTVCCDGTYQEKVRVRLGWANDLRHRNSSMNRDLTRRSTSSSTMGTGVTVKIIGPDGRPVPPGSLSRQSSSPPSNRPDPASGSTVDPPRRTLPSSKNLRRLGGREPYLGIEGDDYAENGVKGVKIMSVAAGSPAKISGLRSDKDPTPQRVSRSCRSTGHVIVSVNEEKVTSTEDLDRILSKRSPGEIIDVTVVSCEGHIKDTLPVRLSAR